jgi:lipid-binding SYLF domain-containing protein
LESFLHDPAILDFGTSVKEARGIAIFPQVLTIAAGIGIEGGNGVLLVQDRKTHEWSGPAFYTMSRAGVGLQGGVEVSEIIFLITSDQGVDAMLSGTATLGLDVSTTFATGSRAEVATATNLSFDILGYARTLGLFLGIAAEGAIMTVRDTMNTGYYGTHARPAEILVQRSVSNPHSAELRAILGHLSHK